MKSDICFVGDIMPGGLAHYQNSYLSSSADNFLKSHHIRVGTLKCPIVSEPTMFRKRSYSIWCKKEDISILKALNINILSLASSHIYDLGENGIEQTKQILTSAGILFCGVGKNIEEAFQPAVIELNGKKIAFIACQDPDKCVGEQVFATENTPGVARFDIHYLSQKIKDIKKYYDIVYILVHWGNEYKYWPRLEQKGYARHLIKVGVDGIFAAHAHTPQPVTIYRKRPIAYNLGNFYFPDFICSPNLNSIYPENNIEKLPRSEQYTTSNNECFIRVWPFQSRCAYAISVNLNTGKILRNNLLILNNSNVLELSRNKTLLQKLNIIGTLYNCPIYSFLRKLRQLALKIANKLK